MKNIIKNKKINLELVSKERSALMGIAILWIVFFHMSVNISQFKLLEKFKSFGNMGVDIFLFISAIGLYYSFKKKPNVIEFYKKRFIRIIPATLICLIPWNIYLINTGNTNSILRFLLDITSVGFWIDGINRGWYVALIIVLYLVFPFIYRLISNDNNRKNLIKCISLCLLVAIINLLICFIFPKWYSAVEIALGRIPIFIVGCFIAPLIYNKKNLPFQSYIIFILTIIIGLILLETCDVYKYSINRYIYMCITIALIPILTLLLNLIKNTIIHRIVEWFGKYTLEIYLIHTQVLTVLSEQISLNVLWINILAVAISIILAVFVHKVLAYLLMKEPKNIKNHYTLFNK